MDFAECYQQAADWAEGRIANVSPSQFDAPTPCAEWNVGDLPSHFPRSPQIFDEPVAVPENASTQDHFIAFLGREP